MESVTLLDPDLRTIYNTTMEKNVDHANIEKQQKMEIMKELMINSTKRYISFM